MRLVQGIVPMVLGEDAHVIAIIDQLEETLPCVGKKQPHESSGTQLSSRTMQQGACFNYALQQ